MAGLRQELDARIAEYLETYSAGDAAKIASFYLDDCCYMMEPKSMKRDRKGVQATFAEFLKTSNKLTLTVLNTTSSGDDTATEVGTYIMYHKDGSVIAAGQYVLLWVKQDGQWFIKYDIANME